MYTLYVMDGCPYCAKVKAAVERLKITLEEKNIADSAVTEELENLGGLVQVPYLYDHDTKSGLYGSDQIVNYLEVHMRPA
jgi:glutaredoxin